MGQETQQDTVRAIADVDMAICRMESARANSLKLYQKPEPQGLIDFVSTDIRTEVHPLDKPIDYLRQVRRGLLAIYGEEMWDSAAEMLVSSEG